MFAPPSALRDFFKCAPPPQLEILVPPLQRVIISGEYKNVFSYGYQTKPYPQNNIRLYRRTDNIMAKRISTTGQTTINKTYT